MKKAQLLKAVLQSSHGVLRLPVLLTADCCCAQLTAAAEGWDSQAARILVPMGPKGDGPRKPCTHNVNRKLSIAYITQVWVTRPAHDTVLQLELAMNPVMHASRQPPQA